MKRITFFYLSGLIFWGILGLFSGNSLILAQEIKAVVMVDRSNLTGATNISHIDGMGQVIERYINTRKWTSEVYREEERIGMTLQITLLTIDANSNIEASIVITAERPIYNTISRSQLFQLSDPSWKFSYPPNRPMIYDPLRYDALTTLLDYYVLLTLGFDGDSFQELGGTPLFKRAQNLVEIAAAAGGAGWASTTTGNRNRYFLISRMNDPNYDRFRKAYYQYHRRGLDGFIDNQVNARQSVYDAINTIWENKRSTADTFVFDLFFNTKYKELTGVFAEAETKVRQQAYQLLTQVDQAHLTEYDKIK